MLEAQIDCTGNGLGYWPDSGLPDSLIPGFLESKKALKEASDPFPCLVSPVIPEGSEITPRSPEKLPRSPEIVP